MSQIELKGWKEIPIGGMIKEPGNARENKTGGWRSIRPILDQNKCISCYFCWLYCPDMCVIIDKETKKVTGFNLDYCKGCGVCANVCPVKAITMKPENELKD